MGTFPTRLSQFYFKVIQTDMMYLSFTHRQPSKPDYWPPLAFKKGLNERNAKYFTKATIQKYRQIPGPLPNMTNENVPELLNITVKWQYNLNDALLTDEQLASAYLQQLLITGVEPTFMYPNPVSMISRKISGRPLGIKTSLQGPFMYDFLDKFTTVVLPKRKGWFGYNKGGDYHGALDIHLPAEVIAMFPEMEAAYEKIPIVANQKFFPMQLTIKTSGTTDWQTRSLLSSMGFPFIDDAGAKEKEKLRVVKEDVKKSNRQIRK